MKPKFRHLRSLAIASTVMFTVNNASAVDYYWNQNSTTAGWGVGGTWNTTGLVFTAAPEDPTGTAVAATTTVSDTLFIGSATTGFAGGTIALGISGNQSIGSIITGAANTTSGVIIDQGTLTFASAGVITNNSSQALTIGSVIAGASTSLTLNAVGDITLATVSNTYGGVTFINSGTVIVNNNAALGTGGTNASRTEIASGARISFNNTPRAYTEHFVIAGAGVGGTSGALTNSQASTTLSGVVTLSGAATIANSGASLVLSGGIALGGNALTFNSSGNTTVQTTAITGTAGSVVKSGTGTLNFNVSNSYAGGTSINAGTLRFDTLASMPATGTVIVADGATLGVTVNTGAWVGGTGVAGIAGLTSTANGGEGFGGQTGAVVNFNGNSFLNLNLTGNITESNAISNGTATSIGLIKSGSSTLTLSGNNAYTGGTRFATGTLIASSANALGTTGNLTFQGGTLQYTASSAANNYGSRIRSSNAAISLNTNSQNVSLSDLDSTNVAGLTKSGAGSLTLTGNNTFTGATTISAGTVVLNNDGDVTGSAVIFSGSNTGLTVTGGSLVTSNWNLNGGNFETSDALLSNVQVSIDGAGTAGSARVTNVGLLEWGRSLSGSTLSLTNGGQMNVNGAVRIGNPYYIGGTPPASGNVNLTIGGGTATSTFTGNGASTVFHIGYGERTGSKDNVVTVSNSGVLTNIGHMVIGHILDAQNADNVSTGNKLVVTGTGTASVASLSLGYVETANAARRANVNAVEVTSGGTLTSSGIAYIGRANVANSQANSNTVTVSGIGSSWNAGGQTVNIGHTNNASATSNDNVLTIASGGSVTNVSSLFVGTGTGTETGNKLVLNGGSLTATTVTVSAGNSLDFGVSGGSLTGSIVNNGAMNIGSNVGVSIGGNISGSGGIFHTGTGTTTFSGDNSYSGATSITNGTFAVTGTGDINSSSGISISSGATFRYNSSTALTVSSITNSGTIAGTGNFGAITVGGTGSVDPGNSPGILTASATNPTSGLDYNFEFTAANTLPVWNAPTASLNDVLRLTSPTTPFTANLGASNAINIYFDVASITAGDIFTGGFYTDNNAAFLTAINSATFSYFLESSTGTISYNGLLYNAFTALDFQIATVSQTANFGGGAINGYVSQFTAVPEPNVAALLGALGGILLLRRRR